LIADRSLCGEQSMKNLRSTQAERRQFWRARFQAPAQLSLADGVHSAELLDISLKGALLELPADTTAALDEQCQLRLELGNGDEAIVMQTTVTHVDSGRRVGLRCDAVDLDSITHLRRLVQLNAGDEALLDRELKALLRD
jgi:hypothetical protein